MAATKKKSPILKKKTKGVDSRVLILLCAIIVAIGIFFVAFSHAGGAANYSGNLSDYITKTVANCKNQTLQYGSTGECVAIVQNVLHARYGIPNTPQSHVDGIFGQTTKNYVILFQGSKGLTQDGIVGPATWAQLLH